MEYLARLPIFQELNKTKLILLLTELGLAE